MGTTACVLFEATAVNQSEKWNLPAWMLRDPGKPVDVEDDDSDFPRHGSNQFDSSLQTKEQEVTC